MTADRRRRRPPVKKIPDEGETPLWQREQPTNARELAYCLLAEQKATGHFLQELFEKQRRTLPDSEMFSRLAHEMAWGIVRRQQTLSTIITAQTKRERENIEADLWLLLAIGVYQLVFLDSIPPHAAIHETVELVKRYGKKRWTGFVNGVLRGISRSLTEELGRAAAENAIPTSDGDYRIYAEPIFPCPTQQTADYFAQAFSFPAWLATRWQARFSTAELFQLGYWLNSSTPPTLRVNILKSTREQVQQNFAAAGIECEPGQQSQELQLLTSTRIHRLPGYYDGDFVVQDGTAMQAALRLEPQGGERLLDLCSAPGTKTTHLAELMGNRGTIVATDVSATRLQRVTENCQRLGIEIVETVQIGSDGSDIPSGPFNRILVDVPCSNTGVLGKRPEARWRVTPSEITDLSQQQVRLLNQALDRLASGGRLVYSTCSIEQEENSHVVQQVLGERTEFKLVGEQEFLPGKNGDGGYQAVIEFR